MAGQQRLLKLRVHALEVVGVPGNRAHRAAYAGVLAHADAGALTDPIAAEAVDALAGRAGDGVGEAQRDPAAAVLIALELELGQALGDHAAARECGLDLVDELVQPVHDRLALLLAAIAAMPGEQRGHGVGIDCGHELSACADLDIVHHCLEELKGCVHPADDGQAQFDGDQVDDGTDRIVPELEDDVDVGQHLGQGLQGVAGSQMTGSQHRGFGLLERFVQCRPAQAAGGVGQFGAKGVQQELIAQQRVIQLGEVAGVELQRRLRELPASGQGAQRVAALQGADEGLNGRDPVQRASGAVQPFDAGAGVAVGQVGQKAGHVQRIARLTQADQALQIGQGVGGVLPLGLIGHRQPGVGVEHAHPPGLAVG